jgi:hypothetical protein
MRWVTCIVHMNASPLPSLKLMRIGRFAKRPYRIIRDFRSRSSLLVSPILGLATRRSVSTRR